MVFMALKIAHDMGVFPVLEKATSPVSAEELAAVKPADPLLLRMPPANLPIILLIHCQSV